MEEMNESCIFHNHDNFIKFFNEENGFIYYVPESKPRKNEFQSKPWSHI